jgi:hypothetical protein
MPRPIMNVADVSLDATSPTFAPTGPAAERFEARTGALSNYIGKRPFFRRATSWRSAWISSAQRS